MAYVDGFLLAMPAKNLPAYKRIAKKASAVWKEHGALQYVEAVLDDHAPKGMVDFTKSAGAKKSEAVVLAFVVYRTKGERNRVNKKIMADPRLADMMAGAVPFDVARMAFGGFKVIVEA